MRSNVVDNPFAMLDDASMLGGMSIASADFAAAAVYTYTHVPGAGMCLFKWAAIEDGDAISVFCPLDQLCPTAVLALTPCRIVAILISYLGAPGCLLPRSALACPHEIS